MEKSIIITAGGIGKRMANTLPKQFISLNGKPILMHTIERFYDYDREIEIILVLPQSQVDFWKELCVDHSFNINHQIVVGGAERFHSVKNGLAIAKGELIGVHDAVRPLVSRKVIANCFDLAKSVGAAIPVFQIDESIRKIEGNNSVSVDRSNYRLVQTPQVFSRDRIVKAYEQEYATAFTDDASVVEANGNKIHLVEGNRENIKITRHFDLEIASLFIKTNE